MSIPPLVCSTPPPPDQCEDDKDPEDFDLSYSLSHEDDDDDENIDYNFGNFSSYDHFQSGPDCKPLDINQPEITQNMNNEVPREFTQYEKNEASDHGSASHNVDQSNNINENKTKSDEDVNIEDLDLKMEEQIVTPVDETSEKSDIIDQNVDSYLKDLSIPSISKTSSPDYEISNESPSEEIIMCKTEDEREIIVDPDEILNQESNTNNEHTDILSQSTVDNTNVITSKEKDISATAELQECAAVDQALEISDEFTEFPDLPKHNEIVSKEPMLDDDFGDFDAFQSVNTTSAADNDCDNPWLNDESNESDFGEFTANFEEPKVQTEILQTESISINEVQTKTNEIDENLEDDDDFGDFDDFQSSAAKSESSEVPVEHSTICPELPVLNLQATDNEHHIMESINKVLTSVFVEEISEPESEFQGKLEALLSETWGHLMEVDERQPYIINWNNSLGQKTLLKALCIDSRNILFGPKWNSNMPKYAANLSAAPLQPQKQASAPSNILQSEVAIDKTSNKPTSWADPFTSNGQESCNNESETPTIAPAPTDLDVFEATVSSKPDKIFSSSLSVQPLRQINLPDTHIFTPTDSEIPRSKTIHYDRGPTVLLPQPVIPDSKSHTDNPVTQSTSSAPENNDDDSEYWEFQDFKSSSDPNSLPGTISQPQTSQDKKTETAITVNALPKPNIAYQTELLQPIKVEPAMPTLNWPAPGEVKGVFDDFSEFVSISAPSSDKTDIPESQTNEISKTDVVTDLNEKLDASPDVVQPGNDDLDDDFDTFQSALPSQNTTNDFKTNSFGTSAPQTSTNQVTSFNYASPKNNSNKSDTISFGSMPKQNEALTQNLGFTSNTEIANKNTFSSGVQNKVLQPTPASFGASNAQNQQKSGQILQPLSLESYSQINWPSPGIDLQDLSRFNPVETLQSLKSDLSVGGHSKSSSPVHAQKNTVANHVSDDDVWGDFVSSKPKQQQSLPKKQPVFVDDDEWTDFISSPSIKPQNGLNTISLNVHTNSNIQKSVQNKLSIKSNQAPLDIPSLNYITPKSIPHKSYNDKHFQNL